MLPVAATIALYIVSTTCVATTVAATVAATIAAMVPL